MDLLQIRTPSSNRNALQSESGTALLPSNLCVLFRPSSRTLVTRFRTRGAIGFFLQSGQDAPMRRLLNNAISWRRFPSRFYFLGAILLACTSTLFADTPGLLRTVPKDGCYCHCSESHRRAGCVKLCYSKRYAVRWGATKCAKPHMQTPANNSNAGPKFPRPGRAEHARL